MPSVGATRETSRPTQPASLDWTTRLLQVDTTSRETNLPLIDLVADELRAHGVEPVLVTNEERDEGQPPRDLPGRRRHDDRRRRPLGAHRRRAGRRAGLVERAVRPRDPRRPPLRPRHVRHEGLHRVGHDRGAAAQPHAAERAGAPGPLLRRGGRLRRRRLARGRDRRARAASPRLHRGRADEHARHPRAQVADDDRGRRSTASRPTPREPPTASTRSSMPLSSSASSVASPTGSVRTGRSTSTTTCPSRRPPSTRSRAASPSTRSPPSAPSPSSSARSGPSTSTPPSRRSAPRRAASRRPCGRRTPTPASRSPSARRRRDSTRPTTRTSSPS